MARFRLEHGYGKHRLKGVTHEAGAELDLDRYDPKWRDRFTALDGEAKALKHAALVLGRKVWAKDLQAALGEAERIERQAGRSAAIAEATQPELPDDVETPSRAPRRAPGRASSATAH